MHLAAASASETRLAQARSPRQRAPAVVRRDDFNMFLPLRHMVRFRYNGNNTNTPDIRDARRGHELVNRGWLTIAGDWTARRRRARQGSGLRVGFRSCRKSRFRT